MNFGRTPPEELHRIDFSLPVDDPLTKRTLSSAGTMEPLDIRVGLTKWGAKEWIGQIYPPKTKDFVAEYAKQFNSVELNATFYKDPVPGALADWKQKAKSNPDFKFCPKFPQKITHIRRLKNVDQITTEFYARINELGEMLGPTFLQLTENFGPSSYENLKSFVESTPCDLAMFVELRHKGWFGNTDVRSKVLNLFQSNNVGLVISDTSRRDCVHMALTIPHAFVRFVGNGNESDYSRLDEWVDRIAAWRDSGLKSLWFFMHQESDRDAPAFADYFIKRLNERLGVNVKRPQFLTNQSSLQFYDL